MVPGTFHAQSTDIFPLITWTSYGYQSPSTYSFRHDLGEERRLKTLLDEERARRTKWKKCSHRYIPAPGVLKVQRLPERRLFSRPGPILLFARSAQAGVKERTSRRRRLRTWERNT